MMGIEDDKQEAYFVERLWAGGHLRRGRNSYQGVASSWLRSGHPPAPAMHAIERVVLSRSPVSLPGFQSWTAPPVDV